MAEFPLPLQLPYAKNVLKEPTVKGNASTRIKVFLRGTESVLSSKAQGERGVQQQFKMECHLTCAAFAWKT